MNMAVVVQITLGVNNYLLALCHTTEPIEVWMDDEDELVVLYAVMLGPENLLSFRPVT